MAPKTKKELAREAVLEAELRNQDKGRKEVDKKYRALLDENTRLRKELEAALEIMNRKTKPFVIPAKKRKANGEATVLACLSDVHCEEVVMKHKVNGLNEHNPDISKRRVSRFFDLTLRFLRTERTETEINNLVLWLGGDFFTSNMHDAPTAMPPMVACMFAQDMLVSGIKFLQENEPNLKIHIVCSVGNHSRKDTGKPVNHAMEQEMSLEYMMYHSLKSIFPEITWQIDQSYHSYVDIMGMKVRFNHGHLGWRYNQGLGGVHGPLWKAITQTWDNQVAADLTVCGHYHTWTPASLNRPYIVNGSTIGVSPYGMQFGSEPPAQMFCLIHSKYGLVGQRPLLVDMT